MPIPPNSRPPEPDRIRSFPRRWGWVDVGLYDSGMIATITGEEALLYLALLCVSDRQGLSWWRDDTLGKRIGLGESGFQEAKRRLLEKRVVGFRPFHAGGRHGVWQVLDLPGASA